MVTMPDYCIGVWVARISANLHKAFGSYLFIHIHLTIFMDLFSIGWYQINTVLGNSTKYLIKKILYLLRNQKNIGFDPVRYLVPHVSVGMGCPLLVWLLAYTRIWHDNCLVTSRLQQTQVTLHRTKRGKDDGWMATCCPHVVTSSIAT